MARSVELLSDGAIPLQLILLGLQLSEARIGKVLREAAPLAGLKLVLPTLMAFGVTAAFGFVGLSRNVVLVQASAPAAMNSLVLALHYDRRPELVAAVILLTTIGSCLTVGLLLAYLMQLAGDRGEAWFPEPTSRLKGEKPLCLRPDT